jgi:beta-phosphoglucomutase-like phosphatase (HAD superfamily)
MKAETETGETTMKKGSRAVIFDMDGVLIDSEPMQLAAYNVVLGSYAVQLSEEDFMRWCVGRRSPDIVAFLRKHFQSIVSGEEVSHGKPAPDIFLEAAQRLAVPPEECVVIEDSQNGVEAAVQAGMYCIAVPNRFTTAQDFSRAHMRVPDLLTVFTLL